MTPKEKAKELVYKFDDTMEFSTPQRYAKQCALISLDEILNINNIKPYILHKEIIQFYQEVKQEIEKL
jgi:hypothetical protein